jgi:hypothetical protein
MEPREDEKKTEEPQTGAKEAKEVKPRRFRIIKLEERIAPGGRGRGGGDLSHDAVGCTYSCKGCC